MAEIPNEDEQRYAVQPTDRNVNVRIPDIAHLVVVFKDALLCGCLLSLVGERLLLEKCRYVFPRVLLLHLLVYVFHLTFPFAHDIMSM